MSDQERVAIWARYTEMIPEELRAVGWTLWMITNGMTLFGDPVHGAVLRKNLEHPGGEQATGAGATEEEAVRNAIREALAIEAASQAQTPQE